MRIITLALIASSLAISACASVPASGPQNSAAVQPTMTHSDTTTTNEIRWRSETTIRQEK